MYPFPIVSEMLVRIFWQKGRCFPSCVDLDVPFSNSGFWQVAARSGVQVAYDFHHTLGAVLLQEDAVWNLLSTRVLPEGHGEDSTWLRGSHLLHG